MTTSRKPEENVFFLLCQLKKDYDAYQEKSGVPGTGREDVAELDKKVKTSVFVFLKQLLNIEKLEIEYDGEYKDYEKNSNKPISQKDLKEWGQFLLHGTYIAFVDPHFARAHQESYIRLLAKLRAFLIIKNKELETAKIARILSQPATPVDDHRKKVKSMETLVEEQRKLDEESSKLSERYNNQISDYHLNTVIGKLDEESSRLIEKYGNATGKTETIFKTRHENIIKVLQDIRRTGHRLTYDQLYRKLNDLKEQMTSTGWGFFKSTGYRNIEKIIKNVKEDLKNKRHAVAQKKISKNDDLFRQYKAFSVFRKKETREMPQWMRKKARMNAAIREAMKSRGRG